MLFHYYNDLERSLTASAGFCNEISSSSKISLKKKRPNFSFSSAEASDNEENHVFLPVSKLKVNKSENLSSNRLVYFFFFKFNI